jgi:hypothetical protein
MMSKPARYFKSILAELAPSAGFRIQGRSTGFRREAPTKPQLALGGDAEDRAEWIDELERPLKIRRSFPSG